MKLYHVLASKVTLTCIVCVLGITTFILFLYYQGVARDFIRKEQQKCFKDAVVSNAKLKTPGLFISGSFNEEPDKIGTYENRLFQSGDTKFIYRSKIVDMETAMIRSKQSYLLHNRMLHSQDIHTIFDSLLHHKGIEIISVVGIVDTFYVKLNDWSRDTTLLKTNLRSSFTNQGIFEDINYYALSEVPFSSVWRLMPHSLIYLSLFASMLTGFFLFFAFRKHTVLEVRTVDGGSKDIEGGDSGVFIKEKMLIIGRNKIPLTSHESRLLTLFMETENYRINKSLIKQTFWPHNENSLTNMTSLVRRVNEKLEIAGCGWAILTDPLNIDYYIFTSKLIEG